MSNNLVLVANPSSTGTTTNTPSSPTVVVERPPELRSGIEGRWSIATKTAAERSESGRLVVEGQIACIDSSGPEGSDTEGTTSNARYSGAVAVAVEDVRSHDH